MRLRTFSNNISPSPSLSPPFFPFFPLFLPPLHSSHFRLVFAPALLRWKFARHRNEFKGGLLRIVWRARARAYIRAFDSRERERKREREEGRGGGKVGEKSGWAKTRTEERRKEKNERRGKVSSTSVDGD